MEKCICGHYRNEHSWLGKHNQNHLEGFAPTGRFFSTRLEGIGTCKNCICPEYKGKSIFRPKHIEYPKRETNNIDTEQRCTRCGRLFSNHVNIDHPFQDTKLE